MSDTDLAFRATLDGSGFASGLGGMHSSLASFSGGLGTATSGIGGLAGSLGMVASPAGIAAAGLMAVGAGMASAVNVAGGFEQKMAGVNAIVGGSAADMKTLSDAAREAGASTQFSASQAADALGYMAGAGWNVQQSTAALKDTLTLAAAGGMDLARAGDLMTNTVSQFGLAATDSGRVANVLAAGASATNTNVSQLGEGMKVVGATANAFGMSLESTTAALGMLSNAGIKGAEGGTALRGVMASLATQTGPAAAAMAELGVSAADVNPETVSLADSMSLLHERGMTATQAIAIFGRENVSAATYMAAHSGELEGLQAKITGTGKASEMAATMTDTYQGAMGELSSAVEEAEISLGTVLLPVVTDFVKWTTEAITATTNFGKALYDGIGAAGEAVASAGKGLSDWLYNATGGALGYDEMKDIGTQTGQAVADGVKENKDLQQATGDTLKSDESKKAVTISADDLAKEFGKQFGSAFEAGMTQKDGGWISWDAVNAGIIKNVGGGDYDNRIKTIGASTVNGVALTSSWFSMSGGTDTMFRLTNEKGNTIAEGSASSLGISDPGSSEGQQAAIRALLARWSVGDVESLELQGRQAEADRLKISMSQTAEIDWMYILDPGKKIESDLSALGEAAGNAIKSGALSGSDAENLFGMAAELNKSRQKYAAEWATIGEDGGKALMDAILKQDWEKVGQLAGQKVGKSFVDSLTGAIHQVESKSIADILKGDLSEIGNMPGWIENTFNPALKTSFSEMYDVYKLGYDQNIQLGVDWVNEIETLYQKHSDWFEDWQAMILEQHATGYMTESQAIDAWKKYEDEAANKVESKQNQQIKQSGMFYGELVDQAAKWTDFINSEGGFVGPTALYDEFRAATDPNKALSADINTKYDIGSVGSIVRIEEAVKIDQTDPLMVHLESVSKEASDALNGPKVATHIEISTLHTTPIVNNSSPADETQQLVTNNPEASLSSVTADQPMVYTRTVKLDTTSARDEFDALKAAIENTDISARLTTSTATSAMNQPGSNISSVDQLGTQSQIGTASIAIKADTSGAKLTVDDLINSINTAHPVMHVTVEIDANAAQIQIAVENAISAALASVRTY